MALRSLLYSTVCIVLWTTPELNLPSGGRFHSAERTHASEETICFRFIILPQNKTHVS